MSLSTTVQRMEYKGADHIYYDIAIRNTTEFAVPAVFSNSNPSLVLDNPSDYYVAVAQFDVQNRGVPILELRADTYQIGINYDGYYQRFLSPVNGQPEKIYSYQRIVELINNAISSMWIEIVADSGGEVTEDDKPVLFLNTETGIASMCYPDEHFEDLFDTGSVIPIFEDLPRITILMYSSLYNLFSALPSQQFPDNLANVANFLLAYKMGGDANLITGTGDGVLYVQMSGEYSTLSLWRDYLSVAFVGLGMPVRNEYYPAISSDYKTSTDTQNNTNIQPILFDFIPDSTIVTNGSFTYQEPTGQYRFVDLSDNMPLNRFSIQCQLRYPDNRMDNLMLFPRETARIKLVFIRKGAGSQTFKDLASGGQLQIIKQTSALASRGVSLA